LFAINGAEKGFYLIHYNQKSDAYDLLPGIYFENYFCSSLCIDKNNRLWIGTNKGLFREKRSTETVEKFTIPQQWNPFNSDLAIGAINISNNKIFAATANEGILVIDRNDQKIIKRIDF
jgi:ligand-binding sensor domain-containing protein